MNPEFLKALDAYLDGSLGAEERAAFEERLRQDAALSAEFEARRAIADALKRQFAAPDLAALQARVAAAAATPVLAGPAPARTRVRWGLVAAVLVLAAAAVWILDPFSADPPAPDDLTAKALSDPAPTMEGQRIGQMWTEFFRQKEAEHFRPVMSCSSPLPVEDFCEANPTGEVEFASGQGVYLEGEMDTGHVETPKCLLLLSGPRKTFFIVYVLTVEGDPRPVPPADSDLYIHRKELGHLVLYELTPLAEPRSLELFQLKST